MNTDIYIHKVQEVIESGEKQNKRSIDKLASGCGISDATLIKELTELAIVLSTRKIAQNEVLSTRERYNQIVEIYRNQVNLSLRTSQSVMLQQYSTPCPISFLASMYVKRWGNALYFEPSAGNGLLTIALPEREVIVNEIDEIRNANLRTQNYKEVSSVDASEPFKNYQKKFDGVITNPPFGSIYEKVMYGEFGITALDHLMALRALDTMKDDGKAAIIVGGHTKYDDNGRIQKGKNRVFLSYLYRYYNVEDVLLINGDLYSRQGTSFNVRLILINGRKEIPEGYVPLKTSIDEEISDFDTLFKRVNLQENTMSEKEILILKAKEKLQLLQALNFDELAGPYRTVSDYPVKPLDTVVPDSMDYEIHSALVDVKDEVGGSINNYVRTHLGYASDEEMASSLSAEQVDAVAMAIYNIEEKHQGIIIGDQTGIGKGRVAAAVIRYACKQGLKPIFITEKANLFSDMYRDLKAIGSADLRPFIVNANESKTQIKDENGEVVYEPMERSYQENVFKEQKLNDNFDYAMLTYSQIASEKPTTKQAFVAALAQGNVLILDESHNAGGNIQTSATARFFYSVVKEAKGVVFLSATFAKRADNMPLYASKTCMQDASLSNEALVEAIVKGGVALQEVLSANLVSEGQMLRRERSFEGIEVNYITLDAEGERSYGVENKEQEHKAISDNITAVLREIIAFQKNGINPVLEQLDDAAKMFATNVEERKGTKELGVTSTPYFSKVFNVINQMLFSIKAEAVAERAIQRLKEGKAPVIAFSSTMGAFLENMENEKGMPVQDGDIIKADFSEVLKKGLDGVFRFSEVDEAGKTKSKELKLEDLSPEAQESYNKVHSLIKNISTGISISPIDIIKHRIENAGYNVAEVTGRKIELQFKDHKSNIALVKSRKKELVNDAFRKFNNNEVDVLLINQSGSTGASAHAIVTPVVPLSEVRQRVMIVLQAELDINREVQKRGRINRTGQVFKPIYDYVNSAIPAEKRLSMMLQKKLKSLDANTTSNQKNSQALLQSEDFLNKYGDHLIVDFLTENPELNEAIGDPLGLNKASGDNKTKEKDSLENAASQVSGRVAVLPTAEQQRFYDDMVERYQNHVHYLLQTGDYDLEVETMNLEASTLEKKMCFAGKGGSKSFGGNTYLEKCEVNVLKKPFKKAELDNLISESLSGKDAKTLQSELIENLKTTLLAKAEKDTVEVSQKADKAIENITNEKKFLALTTENQQQLYYNERKKAIVDAADAGIKACRDKADNNIKYLQRFFKFFHIGKSLYYPQDSFSFGSKEKIPAVFLGFKINYNKPNPFAPSGIVARIAVANSNKYLEFVLSGEQAKLLDGIIAYSYAISENEANDILEKWDDHIKNALANRTIRYIYTGNLLQAYGNIEEKSKLISYSLMGGGSKKGILLPEYYSPGKSKGSAMTIVPLIKAIRVLKGLSQGSMLNTDNGISFMRTSSGFKVITSSLSMQRFSFLIKNETILQYVESNTGFQKVGSCWSGNVSIENIAAVAKEIYTQTNCTVALSDFQLEIIADELSEEKEVETTVFPKLVELEVKLFAMIKDETDGFSGLGDADNVMTSLAMLRQNYPFNPTSERSKILLNMVDEVRNKTSNFTNPNVISEDKVEIKNLLEKEHVSPADWMEYKHSFKRSEADVVQWLANEVAQMFRQNQTSTFVDTDKEKRLKLLQIKAKARLRMLELLK